MDNFNVLEAHNILKTGCVFVFLFEEQFNEILEFLCTALSVLFNSVSMFGEMTPSLFFRFGDGYIVVVRVKGNQPDMTPVMNFMLEAFEDCILKVQCILHNVCC